MSSDAEFWDERYAGVDQHWSGEPNGTLVVEVGDAMAGSALDVGCGEGADAVWLARRGWEVTAVDVSAVAVDRGRAAASREGLAIDWGVVDVTTDVLDGSYDLVSVFYPAFRVEHAEHTVAQLASAVAPGGSMLVVHHELTDDFRARARERGFDPDAFLSPAGVRDRLGDGWDVEAFETRPRPNAPEGAAQHADDVVLRARRVA